MEIRVRKIRTVDGRNIYRRLNFFKANERNFYITGIVICILTIIRITLLILGA